MRRCFLDVDEVLADFVGGACALHGFDLDIIMMRWPPGKWEFNDLLGLSRQTFYAPMSHSFWANLKPTKECYAILDIVEKAFGPENVCLLSKPILNPESLSGKQAWIDKFVPAYSQRRFLGNPKEFCAGPDKVLVDDSEDNVTAFNKFGGTGILVPRHWNSLHALKDEAVTYLKTHLLDNSLWRPQ